MRLKNKSGFVAFPLMIMLGACGNAQTARGVDSLPPATNGAFRVASDVPQGFASSNQASYDDVGYASIAFDDIGQDVATGGEPIDPLAITGGHASLPVPSYAEVTNLDTGRTILVRINQQTVPNGRLIRLSLGAARQLGVEDQARFPVRVRRTNPPEFERAVLRQGQAAGERIVTPPALLGALRKKLGAAPLETVVTRPKWVPKSAAEKPMAPKGKPGMRAGADFATPREPSTASRGDRFIEEEFSTDQRAASAPNAQSDQPAFFVQIAALSVESRARALARQVGGTAINAGSVWRVRKGPYPSEEAAHAALGAIIAKGYGDARVTR